MVNRGAILLRYKAPAVEWINAADPRPGSTPITLGEVSDERTVYLISDTAGDTPETFERWLKRNFGWLFESELEGWYTDPALWPKDRTFKLFKQWFEVELHTVVFDTVDGAIYDDGI